MVVPSLQSVDSDHSNIASGGEKSSRLKVSRDSTTQKCPEPKTLVNSTTVKSDSEKAQPERRVSSRIQAKKELLLRRRVELLDEQEGENRNSENVYGRRRRRSTNSEGEGAVDQKVPEILGPNEVIKSEGVRGCELVTKGLKGENGVVGVGVVGNVVERSVYAKVKETIRIFNKHYLHLVQEEETRVKKIELDRKKSKGSKSKGLGRLEDDRRPAKRPDLKAITKMMESNSILYSKKRFGEIPGIDVGHQFFSRAEMVVVGFHSHWLNGIDYMGQAYKREYSEYNFPLAVAIVLSGMYEDDLDNSEDVVYTGQGGNNLLGNKRQIQDQKMERGNLALKNCMEQSVPVRVVRGHESKTSYCGKVYTYDGLYKVVHYWAEKGISGFTVYKYRLTRVEGQPLLTTNQVQFTYRCVPKSVSEIRGLVCKDISNGQESIPIPATNLVDDPPVAPSGFTYCKSIKVLQNMKLPTNVIGCNCKGTCMDPRKCSCAMLNGGDFPYVHRDGGRLVEAKDVVYECGPKCSCGLGCVNRTSQRGIKFRLEVFRTLKKGWAVRSWDFIPSGAPICEYTGVLTRADEMENISVAENNYIFDIDCIQTMRGLDGRERRSRDVPLATINHVERSDDPRSESVPEYCIDAGSTGNVARFINHSCEPNLFVQCVLSSHHDVKLARVMLFAADNIPPLQELTYDYGYALDSVWGPDGKIRMMPCYCGAADCRKRLF